MGQGGFDAHSLLRDLFRSGVIPLREENLGQRVQAQQIARAVGSARGQLMASRRLVSASVKFALFALHIGQLGS